MVAALLLLQGDRLRADLWFDGLSLAPAVTRPLVVFEPVVAQVGWQIRRSFAGFQTADGGLLGLHLAPVVLTPGARRTSVVFERWATARLAETLRPQAGFDDPAIRDPGPLYVLSRACALRGLTRLGDGFFRAAYDVAGEPFLKRLQNDLGRPALDALVDELGNPKVPRRDLAPRFARFAREFPLAPEAGEARRLGQRLAAMADEDAAHGPLEPARLATMPAAERAKDLVFHLRDQKSEQFSNPGDVEVSFGEDADRTPAGRLAKLGLPAVPAVIDALTDETPTRSVRLTLRRTGLERVFTVGDAAYQVLCQVAHRRFYWPEGVRDEAAGRRAVARDRMRYGPGITVRVEAARIVARRDPEAAVRAMVGLRRDPRRAADDLFDPLASFLAASGRASAVDALAQGLRGRPLMERLAAVDAFVGGLPTDGFPEEGRRGRPPSARNAYRRAVERLLAGELDDLESGGGTSIGGGIDDPVLADLAASALARIFPERYRFRRTASEIEAARIRAQATNVWRRSQGLAPLPLPPPLSVEPRVARLLALGRTEEARQRACVVRVGSLRGQTLTADALVRLLTGSVRRWPRNAAEIEVSARRDADGRGFVVAVMPRLGKPKGDLIQTGFSVRAGLGSLNRGGGAMDRRFAADPKSWEGERRTFQKALLAAPLAPVRIEYRLTRKPDWGSFSKLRSPIDASERTGRRL